MTHPGKRLLAAGAGAGIAGTLLVAAAGGASLAGNGLTNVASANRKVPGFSAPNILSPELSESISPASTSTRTGLTG